MPDAPVERIAVDPLETGAETLTRLKRLDDNTQKRLINWGYAVCDAALRRHVDTQITKPAGFPYPAAGV